VPVPDFLPEARFRLPHRHYDDKEIKKLQLQIELSAYRNRSPQRASFKQVRNGLQAIL
jgi:hypothetical protein